MAEDTQSVPLVERLLAARRQVQTLHAEMEEKTAITGSQALVLCALNKKSGVSQTALVEATSIDRSTLADIVRRLMKKGLVARRRTKQDARAYAVVLTQEGKAVAERIASTC